MCVSGRIPLTNLDHLTDGTLVPGNPNIYYGTRPEQLDRLVRDELSDYIISSTRDDRPIAPSFFSAMKGPNGSETVAHRQASYNGALGARGMHSLPSYGQEETVFDNNTCKTTSIYTIGVLMMFTSHSSKPASPGNQREYFTNKLNIWWHDWQHSTFPTSATAYRKARANLRSGE
jgi:hypothetical protein